MRILIVDDDAVSRLVLEHLVRKERSRSARTAGDAGRIMGRPGSGLRGP